MKVLSDMILTEPLISKVVSVNKDVFLVGGYVRDVLRGDRSRDIDFVVRGDVKGLIASAFPGADVTVVEFKRAMTLRVVVGEYTIDFSELRGTLENDLALRDFTMNAVAWSARGGIADPLNGVADIEGKRIRGISEKNFSDDPLRLLRAYRFAGEFGWKIDRTTRGTLKRLCHMIRRSARERTTLEMIKLLNSDDCLRALKMSLKDGLLSQLFSLTRTRLEANVKALSGLESYLKRIHGGAPVHLLKAFSQGLTHKGLLRAAQLLCGSDMGRNHLRLSRDTFRRLLITGRLLEEYGELRNMNRAQMFELFTEAGDSAMDIALLFQRPLLLREAERFLSMKAVLPAQRVMEVTGLASGPELGAVLKQIRRLQFLGEIRDENDALKWLAGSSRHLDL